jgi:1,4-dihydroxy-2-naphthoate octaprenyltransferase
LFYWYTFLGGLFIFLGLILTSTYTISWSDIPGIISTLLISELLLVNNKSRLDFYFSVN